MKRRDITALVGAAHAERYGQLHAELGQAAALTALQEEAGIDARSALAALDAWDRARQAQAPQPSPPPPPASMPLPDPDDRIAWADFYRGVERRDFQWDSE